MVNDRKGRIKIQDGGRGDVLTWSITANEADRWEDYGPSYYAAYVFDPDGNHIEAVYTE
jgi:hypothetical protein